MCPRQENPIDMLQVPGKIWIFSFYLSIVRVLRLTCPSLFFVVEYQVISNNDADVVKLKSLSSVNCAHLLHTGIICSPFPEGILFFPRHFELANLNVFNQSSVRVRIAPRPAEPGYYSRGILFLNI